MTYRSTILPCPDTLVRIHSTRASLASTVVIADYLISSGPSDDLEPVDRRLVNGRYVGDIYDRDQVMSKSI